MKFFIIVIAILFLTFKNNEKKVVSEKIKEDVRVFDSTNILIRNEIKNYEYEYEAENRKCDKCL